MFLLASRRAGPASPGRPGRGRSSRRSSGWCTRKPEQGDPARTRKSMPTGSATLNNQREDLWRVLEPKIRRQLASAPDRRRRLTEPRVREAEFDLDGQIVRAGRGSKKRARARSGSRTRRRGRAEQPARLPAAEPGAGRERLRPGSSGLRSNQLRFDARNPTARVELVNEATPSVRPNGDRRRQVVIASPLVIGMLVVGLMMLLELRGGRVSDPDELSARMHMPVIGVVPPLPQIRIGTVSPNGNGHANGLPATAGDIKARQRPARRVRAEPRPPSGSPSAPAATSGAATAMRPDHQHGLRAGRKTTLAAQLAERCVNAGMMTLLIDADLRNPTLSRMLDAAESPGLINVLRGEVLGRGRRPGRRRRHRRVPPAAGRGPRWVDPSRLLQGERLGKLIACRPARASR